MRWRDTAEDGGGRRGTGRNETGNGGDNSQETPNTAPAQPGQPDTDCTVSGCLLWVAFSPGYFAHDLSRKPLMFPQNDDPTTFIRPGLWLTASQQGGREENNCILPFISYSAVK